MAKLKLTPEEKAEIKRLTQFANRRIKAAQKVYAQEGKMVLPKEVVGDIQLQSDWATSSTPLSRSVVFEDKQAYKDRLSFLRSFESRRPTITQYTRGQAERTISALETALGDVPQVLRDELNKMTSPQLSSFWNQFSRRAVRMGGQYSSEGAALGVINQFFDEDFKNLFNAA